MKRAGRHPIAELTAAKVRNLKQPGRHTDGNGLYLTVDKSGAKRWLLRTVAQGRRRDIGLGSIQTVSLAEARQKATDLRRVARGGGDPLSEKRRSEMRAPTFEQAARSVHGEHTTSWRNSKHSDQWLNTLTTYAFPIIGRAHVDQIETPEILKVLLPIWLKKPETARRVKQRISTVLDWAKASGFRSGDNPVVGVTKGLPKQAEQKGHHRAVAFVEVPSFIEQLRFASISEPARLAFEFLILTAARTNEVLRADWSEIDFKQAVWTIPAARMKAGKEHRVPLPARCLEILHSMKAISPDQSFIFSPPNEDRPLSNMVFLMALRRMNIAATAHGFRSAFRDWASERTNFSREVCEMALAHAIKDKTEAAYRRGDLFQKRRALMKMWASYLETTRSVVVAIR